MLEGEVKLKRRRFEAKGSYRQFKEKVKKKGLKEQRIKERNTKEFLNGVCKMKIFCYWTYLEDLWLCADVEVIQHGHEMQSGIPTLWESFLDFLSLSWPPQMRQPGWKILNSKSQKNLKYDSSLVAWINVTFPHCTCYTSNWPQSSFFSQFIFLS